MQFNRKAQTIEAFRMQNNKGADSPGPGEADQMQILKQNVGMYQEMLQNEESTINLASETQKKSQRSARSDPERMNKTTAAKESIMETIEYSPGRSRLLQSVVVNSHENQQIAAQQEAQ